MKTLSIQYQVRPSYVAKRLGSVLSADYLYKSNKVKIIFNSFSSINNSTYHTATDNTPWATTVTGFNIQIKVSSKAGIEEVIQVLNAAKLPFDSMTIEEPVGKEWMDILSSMNFERVREEHAIYWKWKSNEKKEEYHK